jgi:lipopolysaccharide/colanic/teichoic acid biosynthesis glycosyltransferase
VIGNSITESAPEGLALFDPAAGAHLNMDVAPAVSASRPASSPERRVKAFACQLPPRRPYTVFKFWLEWSIAIVLLLATMPLMIVLAALVKITSPGPAFYSQVRSGFRGKPYRIYKLRTMTHNAESKTGAVWSTKNDCRITPMGRVLRDTHLDELPQLWNIVRGEMCLIGPRPERPEIIKKLNGLIPNYEGRHLVRPGVTGLAQMRLPADSDLDDVKKKVAHDLYYVRALSFSLDVRIAVCTSFYFLAAAATAVCKVMVDGHGKIVERSLTEEELSDSEMNTATLSKSSAGFGARNK